MDIQDDPEPRGVAVDAPNEYVYVVDENTGGFWRYETATADITHLEIHSGT